MKRKFNWRGYLKNTMYGFMDGAAMAYSWIVSGFAIYGTAYCFKNKEYREYAKWFAFLSAVTTFQAARNSWMTAQYLDGKICDYDWTIEVNDDEEENVDEI